MISYTSYGFFLLVSAGLILSGFVRPKRKKWILLAMSLIFLVLAGGALSIWIWMISTAAGFAAAFLLERDLAGRRLILALAAVFQLGLLAYFKYANLPFYTMEALCDITGRSYEFEPVRRPAVLGISFYTLMIIGYDLDVYRGERQAVRSAADFSLFTGYFGHLVQGPVDSYEVTGTSLAKPDSVSFEGFRDGCLEILTGLFKKLIISERLAIMVNTIYGEYTSYKGWYLALAAGAFSLQLYTDFSGCMDLMSGISRLFGVRLCRNFRQPFSAESVSEVWRRWHITLGGFLRKNIYIPLGGNRKGLLRKYVNVMAVFLISGLWHGGKWTFIIGTGILQGIYMIGEELFRPAAQRIGRAAGVKTDTPFFSWIRRLRTFILVSVGFVLFRADSLAMAGQVLGGIMQKGQHSEYGEGVFYSGLGTGDFAVLVIGLAVLFFLSVWRENHGEEKIIKGDGARTGTCFAVLFLILLFGWYGKGYDMGAFIYSRF